MMAVNWKQIMIMRLKGVSQDRVAGAARCSKRDVARASRVFCFNVCSTGSAVFFRSVG
ncbi:hypothetical protein [Bifidobacterium longum]|uniref:hypothetical protein n=1 Tax=Bifidobacterium longum TaxID=216816 RepID=UPI00158074FB|nr:hypothetical protein [Bifidobacterium longum]MDW3065373.1 hypothetical protein [Bifidobacterium longum]